MSLDDKAISPRPIPLNGRSAELTSTAGASSLILTRLPGVPCADRRPLCTGSQSILLHRRTRLAARPFHRESIRSRSATFGAC
jgi:hypothetical protein